MIRTVLLILLALFTANPTLSATLRVPQDHKTLQAAIDAASTGDTITVAPGKYLERIKLQPGIILRSEGDDTKETDGLKRAETTVIDGGGKTGELSGAMMAERSTLDGFTVTLRNSPRSSSWSRSVLR